MRVIDDNPWSWMQSHDTQRFGAAINDRQEQIRWCTAMLVGGLPYMWRQKATVVRELMYDKMEIKAGDKVLVLGESLESCGFLSDIQDIVGPRGEVRAIDIIEEARDAVLTNKRGRNGKLGTWRYDYTSDVPDAYFDCVAVLQGIQHTDDWRDTGQEMLRIMKPGRVLMLSEIGFGPRLKQAADLDLHIEYWLDKMLIGAGLAGLDFSYYSEDELFEAFDGLLHDPRYFSWRGADLFWGRKP